jgi:peroxiredoxin Q/BCP
MLSAGELAPDFDIPAHDGTRVKLSELGGKYVVLWFYPAADTPG